MRQINGCKNFPIALKFVYRLEAYMSNLSMGLCGNLPEVLFGVHLHCWLATYPLDKVICPLNNLGLVFYEGPAKGEY